MNDSGELILCFNQCISKWRDLSTWWQLANWSCPAEGVYSVVPAAAITRGGVQMCQFTAVVASNRTVVSFMQKGKKKKKKQPKCTWRVYCRIKGTSSSAFPISEGCNVNSLSLFLSFQLTQLLIQCDFLLAFIFMLFFSDFYLLMGAITLFFLFVCFSYCLCCLCDTHFLLTWSCSVVRQRWTNKDAGGLSCLVKLNPASPRTATRGFVVRRRWWWVKAMKHITTAAWYRRSKVTDLPLLLLSKYT